MIWWNRWLKVDFQCSKERNRDKKGKGLHIFISIVVRSWQQIWVLIWILINQDLQTFRNNRWTIIICNIDHKQTAFLTILTRISSDDNKNIWRKITCKVFLTGKTSKIIIWLVLIDCSPNRRSKLLEWI